jgi:hypothetical protein
MSEANPVSQAAPMEILTQWEGAHQPGVLFKEAQGAHSGIEPDVAGAAAWIAVAALSGDRGHATSEAIQKKVVGLLSAWRRRFGQAKIDEVKQQLFLEMQQNRNHAKIKGEEVRERIERLFGEIQD